MKLYSDDSYYVLACDEPIGSRKSYKLKLLSPDDVVFYAYSSSPYPVGSNPLLNIIFDVSQVPRYARICDDADKFDYNERS